MWRDGLRRWAIGDRVRASPREGRLLRVAVGACVRIGDTAAEVRARVVHDGPADAWTDGGAAAVTYVCRGSAGDLRLTACRRPDGQVELWLAGAGGPARLGEDEVEVYG